MRVLVTGAARELGAEVVRRLEHEPAVDELLGLDFERPPGRFRKLRLIRGDLRQPSVSARIHDAAPEVVVHCALHTIGGSMRAAHEWNVIGTMNLLAGCAGIHKLVLRSSALVYPVGVEMPSLLLEDDGGGRPPRGPLGRDFHEIEGLVADFGTAHPETVVTILRLGQLLGPRWRTLLSDYLARPAPPTLGGFDPRLQVLAEEDAGEAVVRAVTADHPGVYNVAAEGILLLSQLLAMAGRPATVLPPLASTWLQRQVGLAIAGVDIPPDLVELLSAGCVMDTSKSYAEFGWCPPRTARETVDEFVLARSSAVITA